MGDRHGRYRMREKLMRKKLMRRRLRRALFPMVMGSFMTMAAVGLAFYQSGRGGNSGKGTVTKEAKGVGAAIGPIIRHGFGHWKAIRQQEAREYGRNTVSVYRNRHVPEKGAGYLGEFEVTGYCGCKTCCGKKDKSLSRTGTEPRAGQGIPLPWIPGSYHLEPGLS